MVSRKPTGPKPQRIYGPETWRAIGGRDFTHWDLWYLVILTNDHSGDWAGLEAALIERAGNKLAGYERDDVEAKLAHLEDLRRRLDRAGLVAPDLLEGQPVEKRFFTKARDKLFRQTADRKSEAMRRTPTQLLRDRAMTGHWPSFPTDPVPFHEELLEEIEDREFYSWRSTGGLASRISEILESQIEANAGDPAGLLACHRAALTALVEAQGVADDSGGYLGGLAHELVPTYLGLQWRDTGIDPATYYRDFVEFAVWEDYAVTWEKTDRFFRGIPGREAELVERIIREVVEELTGHRFMEYRVDEALDLMAELYVFKEMLDRFVPGAAEMGSRQWRRILIMAEAALKAGRRDLGLAVFSAADQPGFHRDHLRKRCVELLGEPPPERALHAVPRS